MMKTSSEHNLQIVKEFIDMNTSLVGTNTYAYKVKTQVDRGEYWEWGCSTLTPGTWKKMIGLFGNSSTYCFEYAEDATAFKLRFNI